ncbi:MAG: tRNA (adenosine(37)-N6)-threonylcarbamoyltransferase complex dimerization subunit type 1 TsaB [Bacteroidales bacterium]|nr:tRNA (adenosine(37)-N6)-threonylcarbamoyltransferase complex dimerization subunit type 1 TsaB [Bacteroidales bacterium]
MIICLETSTSVCSVALCDSKGVIDLRESSENKSHASLLTLFIDDLLTNAGVSVQDLESVVVSKGPGSYTGLRIGVSAAKGLAYAASVPLIGVETTLSMFYGITDNIRKKYGVDNKSLLIPMIDARRMEVYYSVYTSDGMKTKEISAEIIDENTFTDIPESVRILIFGDGAAKCRQVLKRKNIDFASEFRMSAAWMYKPAYESLGVRRFEDVAYFEPFYLKDFIATTPKGFTSGK